jgi:hypothetical protein
VFGFYTAPILTLAAFVLAWIVSVKIASGDEELPSDQPYVGAHAPDQA